MKNCIIFLVLTFVGLLPFESIPVFAQDAQSAHGNPEPPRAGIHWARGQAPDPSARTADASVSPNLIWHGGNIMVTAQTTAIFWGQNWNNPTFIGDKFTGLDSFYRSIGNSTYADTSDEYTDTSGPVSDTITYTGNIIDLSAAPSSGSLTEPILAEVCKVISNPVANGYYPVYVDTPRGQAGFCAWHSAGSCNGTPVQFAFFFNLDGDAGCDPQDTSGLHSQGLAALANVSGHEISEARTNPRLDAWYDSSGQENADKCAWSFGSSLVTFSNTTTTTQWKIQGNWSNKAYDAGTGYANLSGQKGCIDGGNFKMPITPMVYVKDKTVWQYKRLTSNLAKEEAPSEEELNALGKEGWELAGIVTDHPIVRFYFKRLKD
jgi:hypothetical protein